MKIEKFRNILESMKMHTNTKNLMTKHIDFSLVIFISNKIM